MKWSPVASNVDAPAARYGHVAVAVDTREDWGTELVVLHGGTTKLPSDQEIFLEDVAVFHVEQEAWIRPQISSDEFPGPRAFHAATAVNQGLLFFGGQALIPNTSSRTTFNDIWYLPVASWKWERVAIRSEHQPSARSLSSLLYIGEGMALMFGGRNESSQALNDLWILDIDKGLWTPIEQRETVPLPRIKQAMAHMEGVVWLFGGETTTGSFFDDLWKLERDGSSWTWTEVKYKPKMTGRSGHCLIPVREDMMACFGGHTPTPVYMIFSQSHYYSKDLWIFDSTTSKQDDNAGPIERVCPSMVPLQSGKLLLFGGRGKEQILGDTWWLELDPIDLRSPSVASTSSRGLLAGAGASPTIQDSKTTVSLGSMWSNMPLARGLLSRVTTRVTPDEQRVKELESPIRLSQVNQGTSQEMTSLANGRVAGTGGLDALYSFYDIIRDIDSDTVLDSQPDDHYIDLALISHAQAVAGNRERSVTVDEARQIWVNSDPRLIKLGNLWLLLADYKRLLLKSDVLHAWRQEHEGRKPKLNARYLHFSVDTLRMSDLPELLVEYRRLVDQVVNCQ